MKFGLFLCVLSVTLQTAFNAPVDIKEESKRRETTKETLELENALKRLAGENKQYYPGVGVQPIPQVDGLDDGNNPEVNVNGLSALEKLQKENEESEETENELEQKAAEMEAENEEREESEENQQMEQTDESESSSSEEQDISDDYQAIPNYYPEQEMYDSSYDYRNSYPYYGNGGDFDSDALSDEYAVQDVMQLLENHPELFSQIIKAKSELQQEMQEEAAEVPNDNQPEEPVYNAELQPERQIENFPTENDEDILDEMKAMQQYEKLQDLYGDSNAHVVAKKMFEGPMDYPGFYHTENDANDGSGDHSSENKVNQQETNDHEVNNQIFDMPVM